MQGNTDVAYCQAASEPVAYRLVFKFLVYKQDWTQNYDPGRISYTPFSMSHRFLKSITELRKHTENVKLNMSCIKLHKKLKT